MQPNELYLVVLPIVHIGLRDAAAGFGATEQILTLSPDRLWATEFFPDEVEMYLITFKTRADKYLVGGHVTSYDFVQEPTEDGRIVVKVLQNVS